MVLYFVYGLAFFSVGISVLIYPKKNSEFHVAHTLWLVALFGITHGIHEWLGMFLLLKNLPDGILLQLKTASLVTLPVSFLFLVSFGMESMYGRRNRNVLVRTLPAVLFVIWIAVAAASRGNWVTAEIWAEIFPGYSGHFSLLVFDAFAIGHI